MSKKKNQQSTIIDVFKRYSAEHPNDTVFIYADKTSKQTSITYGELYTQVITIAANLQNQTKSNEKVLILVENNSEFVPIFMACLFIKAIPIVIPLGHNKHELIQHLKQKINIDHVIIGDNEHSIDFPEKLQLRYKNLLETTNEYKQTNIEKSDLAFLQFSSGSTNYPKGIMISHENVYQNLYYAVKRYGKECFHMGCCWTPIQHDMSLIGGLLLTLYTCKTSVLMQPELFLEDSINWLNIISQHNVSYTFCPNFSFSSCIDIPNNKIKNLDLTNWKLAINGGEVIQYETLKQFYEKFSKFGFKYKSHNPCYGLAESTMVISASHFQEEPKYITVKPSDLHIGEISVTQEKNLNDITIVSCGVVLDDHEIVIVSPDKEKLNTYQIGEIWIAGPSVAKGYWKEPGLSNETFHNKLKKSNKTYLKTGDLGFLDKDNHIYIVGRSKDIVIYRGKNHYLTDIEKIVSGTSDALKFNSNIIFPINESDGAVGLLQEVDSNSIDYNSLAITIKKIIAKQLDLRLDYIAFLKKGKLPRTSIGKIKRNTAKEKYYTNTREILYVYNKNDSIIKNVEYNNTNNDIDYALKYLKKEHLFGAIIPKKYGGMELEYPIFLEKLLEVSKYDLEIGTVFFCIFAVPLIPLILYGDERLKKELLPSIVTGDTLLSFSLTESTTSNPGSMETYFQQTEYGFTINGSKSWGGASWATHSVLFARNDSKIKSFILNLDSKNISRGETYKTMGLNLLQQASLTIENENVNEHQLLDKDGIHILETTLNYTRVGIATLSLGSIISAASTAIKIIKAKTIASGQLINHPIIKYRISLARTYIIILKNAIRLISHLIINDKNFPIEFSSLLKAQASDWANYILQELFLSLGGNAYIKSYGFEKIYQTSIAFSIIEGSNDSLFSLVGRTLLESKKIQNYFDKIDGNGTVSDILDKEIFDISTNISESYSEKDKRLYVQYMIGKNLSPLLLHLLLKYTPNISQYNIDPKSIEISLQYYQSNLNSKDNSYLYNNNDATNETCELLRAQNDSNQTELTDWIINWCISNIPSCPKYINSKNDFFEIGMDSLYASMLTNKINQEHNIDIESSSIWEYSIIEDFVRNINK